MLAAVPFVGSMIALGFEVGYLHYFDIPAEYIEVGFNRIVAATAALAIPLLLLWFYLAQVIRFFETSHPFWHVVGSSMLYALIPLIAVIFGHTSSQELLIPLGIFLFFVGAYLLPPSLKRSATTPYWDRVRAQLAKDKKVLVEKKPSTSEAFLDILLIPLTVAFFGMGFCGYLGYTYARAEKQRWVVDEEPQYLVIRKYGEIVVLKQYDPVTRKLIDNIELRKLGDRKALRMRKVNVGELVRPDNMFGG
jgi:hypothetical protein